MPIMRFKCKKHMNNHKKIGSSENTTIDNSDYLINQKQTVEKTSDNTIKQTMQNFVNCCNQGNIEEAYNMLTDECKEKLYPTVQDFYQNYITIVFNEEKEYTMQAWDQQDDEDEIGIYTYSVTIMQNILATGNAGNKIQEYYTFIKQSDGSYKINVNNYIYSEAYDDLSTTQDGIKVEILSKDVYKDYAIYEFQVYNFTDSKVLLNGSKARKAVYLSDKNDVVYSSIQSEFDKGEEIIINAKNYRKFRVKFNKKYNTNVVVRTLNLTDVVFNYDEYKQTEENGEQYTNRELIQADLL